MRPSGTVGSAAPGANEATRTIETCPPRTDARQPGCQLERVVHEERVGGGRPLVAGIDLALVLLPGGDGGGGQLSQPDVGGRARRGAERNGECHDGGNGRRREPFARS